jgi:type IV pilus assembly protein PilA
VKGKTIIFLCGFTLIETMILVAMMVIVLAVALPIYSNYIVRGKVEKAISMGEAAKTAITEACKAGPNVDSLTSNRIGFLFRDSPYINSIEISGHCAAPVITITTQNTGATIDPVLLLAGKFNPDSDKFLWTCRVINGQDYLMPDSCQN